MKVRLPGLEFDRCQDDGLALSSTVGGRQMVSLVTDCYEPMIARLLRSEVNRNITFGNNAIK